MRIIRRIFMLLLCLFLAQYWLGTSAYGTVLSLPLDPSVSIVFKPKGKAAPSACFSLYQVASLNDKGDLSISDHFTPYLHDCAQETLQDEIFTILGYIASDGIKPDYIAQTSESGIAESVHLPLGIYLVVGDTYCVDGYFIMPSPFIMSLPSLGANGRLEYNVRVYVKYTARPVDETIDIELKKRWVDNNSNRPASVSVGLYNGSILHDTAILSAENNWQYKWTGLYAGTQWYIRELKIPDGYTSHVDVQGNCFELTNTMMTQDIPQTGMLLWPVPVLLITGVVLTLIGRYGRWKKIHER